MIAGDIVDEAVAQLHGYNSSSDRTTSLITQMSEQDFTFTVSSTRGQSTGITPGVVEIESEQVYVTDVDPQTGICTIAPGYGRGYNSSRITAHNAGVRVVSDPKFPRSAVLRQINFTIGALYPQIFAVEEINGFLDFITTTYPLTDTKARRVLVAQWQTILGDWYQLRSYSIDPYDNSVRIPTGNALPGRPFRARLEVEPVQFASEADDYSVTGLPDSCSDILSTGAVMRMAYSFDASRIQLSTIEQSARSTVVAPNSGLNLGKYLQNTYNTRVTSEATALRRRYPPQIARKF